MSTKPLPTRVHVGGPTGGGNYYPPPPTYTAATSRGPSSIPSGSPRSGRGKGHTDPGSAPNSNGSANNSKYSGLASMLRECAGHVDRNEFHPIMYQALGLLHQYAGENAGKPPPAKGQGSLQSDVTPERSAGAAPIGRLSRQGSSESLPARTNNHAPTPDMQNGHATKLSVDNMPSQSSSRDVTSSAGSNTSASIGGSAGAHNAHNVAKDSVKFLGKISKKALHGIHVGATKLTQTASGDERDRSSKHLGVHAFDDAESNDWCEEHFTMGCQCKKVHRNREIHRISSGSVVSTTPIAASTTTPSVGATHQSPPEQNPKQTTIASQPSTATQAQHQAGAGVGAQQQAGRTVPAAAPVDVRPCFQRPVNPKSNLIANGWIEQQRRSKMRVVWKDILASLVEGRRPGEETTLWIQRQVTSSSGKQELEALHQIPMKWIEDVSYLDFYGDHRFALKIYNVADEFQFRTRDEESAQNWVVTLKSAVDASSKASRDKGLGGASGAASGPNPSDAGLNTLDDDGSVAPTPTRRATSPARIHGDENAAYNAGQDEPPSVIGGASKRLTIRELRAIANSAGVDTRGMERADLERIAARVQGSSSQPENSRANEADAEDKAAEERRRQQRIAEQQAVEERRRRHVEQQAAEQRRQQQQIAEQRAAEERRRQQTAAEELRRQQIAEQQAAEERRQQQIAAEQRVAEERRRQQLAEQEAAEERRRQQVAEQQAAEERRRQQQIAEQRAAEERRRQAEQQAAAEQRRRQQMAEQQAAEQRRRQMAEQQAAEQRRQQQFQQQQQQQQWNQQQQFPQQHAQQPFFSGQHQQQQRPPNQPNQQPFASSAPPPPPPGQNPTGSPINAKYAKAMTDKTEDEEQAAITAIKRNILIHWALQPPMLNALRPIDHLICSIHSVFPPAFGVAAHDYFKKWKPVTSSDLVLSAAMGHTANEEKLKKAVRKIRFFLHPDKLPKDLNSEQEFMCKMLWDVTSDAWEEFCTKNEELDWIRS